MNRLFGNRSQMDFLRRTCLVGKVLALGMTGVVGQVTNSTWVDFPDPSLSNAVHQALGLPPGRLSTTNVLGLTNLMADSQGITNLEGLEWATNLSQLYLGGNHLSDLAPLGGLTNLSWLNAGDNLITNAGAVAGLTSLRGLWLHGNGITDLSFLQGLTNLSLLSLVNDPISDLSRLPMLSNLNVLALGGQTLSNLTALSSFGALSNLAVVGSGLKDLSFLSGLSGLRVLDLDNNLLQDAAPLAALSGLSELNLDHNQLSNAAALAGLTNLTSLQLLSNGLNDVSFVSGLKALRQLNLDNNNLADVRAVSGLSNLVYLSLENNRLTLGGALAANGTALGQLPNLATLNLGGNQIGDLGFLAGLRASNSLVNLSLAHNLITNSLGLESLSGLRGLDVGDNRLTEVSVLTNLPRLAWVNLQWNFLNTNTSALAGLLQGLTQRGVAVYSQPQHQPPRLSFISGPPSLLNLGRWAVAAGANSAVAFVAAADANAGTSLQFSTSSSDAGLVPTSNIVVTATQTGWTLALRPAAGVTNSANPLTVTLRATDGLGQTTSLGLQLTVMSPQAVAVPDPHLEAAIRQALAKPSGTLNNLDLFGLSSLSAYEANISSLWGLEWASNLTCLEVGGNSISDLNPLRGLAPLQSLSVYNNLVWDLSPLAGLTNLTYLDLRWNGLTNLDLLVQLTHQTALFLGGNSNINILTNWSKLTLLDLDHCWVSNLSAVSALSNLTTLDVSYNPVTNVTVVSALNRLTNLYVSGDGLSDLSWLTNLNLKLLSCYSNNVADLSPLMGLTNLSVFNGGHNPLGSSAPLGALSNLQAVLLRGTAPNGLAWLQSLPALGHLELGDDALTDTTALASLTNLQSLSLVGNPLTNLAGLSFLTNLVHLNLDRALNAGLGGQVTRDLSAVEGLSGLSFLSVSQNQLTNINGLTNLTALQELDVRTNLLELAPNSGPLTVLQALTNRAVRVRYQPQDAPPELSLVDWPPTLLVFSTWAVATNALASFSFYVADDVSSAGALQVQVSSSDPSLIDPANILVSSTNNIRTVELVPTNGPGAAPITVSISDGSGLQTNFTITVQVLEPQPVSFADPNLEWVVRTEVQKPTGPLSSVDLQALTTLSAFNLAITNLSGLEWASNLTSLDLRGSAVSQLGPLQGLQRLNWLNLFGNQVADLTPLVALTNLSYLDVSSNPLTNFNALSSLPSLQSLSASANAISDLSFLTNLSSLGNLNLETNRLTDIAPLRVLTNLSRVLLQQNRLTDISALSNLTDLAFLDVRYNLLNLHSNAAIGALQAKGTFVLDLPQRSAPLIDVRTNWLVSQATGGLILFNVWDTGPIDEQVGVGIPFAGPDLQSYLFLGAGTGGATLWWLGVNPTAQLNGTNVVESLTLGATNDLGMVALKTISVVLADPVQVDGTLLGDTNLTWSSGRWFGQDIVSHDGHPVAQSGAVANNQVSWLQTVVNGPGRLSFWWKVSSQTNSDWLEFGVTGQTNRISGEVDWQYQVVDVPPGNQMLTWRYYKDIQGSSGWDAGWLDEVTFQRGSWLELVDGPNRGGVTLVLHTILGRLYEVQTADGLQDISGSSTRWVALAPPVLVTNASFVFVDTNAVAPGGGRFYRVHDVETPIPDRPAGNRTNTFLDTLY